MTWAFTLALNLQSTQKSLEGKNCPSPLCNSHSAAQPEHKAGSQPMFIEMKV